MRHAGNLSVGELETREATCEKLIQDLKIQVQTSTKISGEFLGTDVQLSYCPVCTKKGAVGITKSQTRSDIIDLVIFKA